MFIGALFRITKSWKQPKYAWIDEWLKKMWYIYTVNIICPQKNKRKAMTNLDSIVKNRDITLLTKIHIVKVMVFPGVMYKCESWTIKKAEC